MIAGGDGVRPEHVKHQAGDRRLADPVAGQQRGSAVDQQLAEAGDDGKRSTRAGSSSLGSARRRATAPATVGRPRSRTPVTSRKRTARGFPRGSTRSSASVSSSVHESSTSRRSANHDSRSSPGRPSAARAAVWIATWTRALDGGAAVSRITPSCTVTQPVGGSGSPSSSRRSTSTRAAAVIRRRNRGGVTTVVTRTTRSSAPYSSSSSTPWARPMLGEDQPDLATGDHPDADQHAVDPNADRAERRHELAGDGDRQQHSGIQQHVRLEHRLEVGVHADEDEEHGDEHAADAVQITGDALLVVAPADGQPGHEGADDEGQLGRVGQDRQAEHDDQGRDGERGAGAARASEDAEGRRDGERCRPARPARGTRRRRAIVDATTPTRDRRRR